MGLSEVALKKLSKEKVFNITLDYQSKFDSTLAWIRNKHSELKKQFEKLEKLALTCQWNVGKEGNKYREPIGSNGWPGKCRGLLLVKTKCCKNMVFKEKVEGMDLLSLGIRGNIFINNSLCKYYKLLWKKYKACSQTNIFTPFGTYDTVRLKTVENGWRHVATHLSDLKELLPEKQLLSEED